MLMVPTSAPRENLYIETGIRDMTHNHDNMTHRRINMLCRLETTNSNMITSMGSSQRNLLFVSLAFDPL